MARIILKYFKISVSDLIQLHRTPEKNACVIRLYCTANKSQKEEELDSHSYTYIDTSSEYKMGKKCAVAKLQELFNLRLFTATDIATRFKKLHLVTGKTMSNNRNLLKQEGVSDDILLKYPDVLAQKHIEEEIQLLKDLSFEIRDTVPLLSLELVHFKQFLNKQTIECQNVPGGRLGYISRLFGLPILEVCEVLTNRAFLRNIDLVKLEKNYKLLIDFGIGPDEIRRDYWVLRYNTEVIQHRLDLARKLNVDKIKTWMVRAQADIFNTYIQRRSDNKLILGESSLAEYLSERLECSLDISKVILTKHPALSRKSMMRMKEVIEFLYADGFTPGHIVRSPKILLHSVETTRKRLRELESQGMKVDSLHILTKSQKQYMHYYENLVKTNKNKMKDTV